MKPVVSIIQFFKKYFSISKIKAKFAPISSFSWIPLSFRILNESGDVRIFHKCKIGEFCFQGSQSHVIVWNKNPSGSGLEASTEWLLGWQDYGAANAQSIIDMWNLSQINPYMFAYF